MDYKRNNTCIDKKHVHRNGISGVENKNRPIPFDAHKRGQMEWDVFFRYLYQSFEFHDKPAEEADGERDDEGDDEADMTLFHTIRHIHSQQ